MAAHNKCPKYADTNACPGYENNKTCSHCDHNKQGYTAITEQTKQDKQDKIKAAMDNLLKIFESGNLEVVTRAVFRAPEGSQIPSDSWSFMNRIFMMCAGTDDARGYRQWQTAGRQVKAGSSSFYIFAPMIKKYEDKETHEEKIALYGFKNIPVFRIEDTDGAPVIRSSFEVNIPCNFDSILNEMGLTVKTMAFNGSAYGYYSPSHKVICMATPEIKTFLHELSHAVDDKMHHLRGGQHNDQEVVAEFSAAVIGQMMGYKIPLGNCKQYIEGYSFRELMHQLNRCEKVIKFIMDRTSAPAMIPAPCAMAEVTA